MILSWTDFKDQFINKNLQVQYAETDRVYKLIASDGPIQFKCKLLKGSSDANDFEDNYKSSCNGLVGEQKDSDGSIMARSKITKSGWHYHMHCIEFEIGTKDSIRDKKSDYTNYGYTTLKFYDVDNVEKTTQETIASDAVWTVLDFEPTHDYDVAGGMIRQISIPSTDIILFVIAVPDLTEAQGGSKVFVSNVNLRFLPANGGIDANGRAPKTLYYNATYHTGKIRIKLRHDIGVTHKVNFIFEMFKA